MSDDTDKPDGPKLEIVPPPEPDQQDGQLLVMVPRTQTQQALVVGMLRELLGLAEQGKFADFAFVATLAENPSGYQLRFTPTSNNLVALLGAIDILQSEIRSRVPRRPGT